MLPKKSNIQQNKNQSKKKVRFDMDKNQLHKLFFVESYSPTAAYDGSNTAKNYSEVLASASDAQPNSSDSFRLRTVPQRFNMRLEDFPDLSHSLKMAAEREMSLSSVKFESSDMEFPPTLDKSTLSVDNMETESSSNEMPEQNEPAKKLLDDQFGMLALASMIRNTNPVQTLLCKGLDLTQMGLDLNCPDNLLTTFTGGLDDIYGVDDSLIYLPKEYKFSGYVRSHLQPLNFKYMPLETLFYIFYMYPRDQYQLQSAEELYERQWRFHKVLRVWVRRSLDIRKFYIDKTIFTGEYEFYSPELFKIFTQITAIDESQFAKRFC
ncbi:CCR4-NOT transcription complex subunit 2-like [Teleopsis dalmanni]|uniref:CCR4-NOT transcription complex subunit 2-like n=1 Tax=Teleopsis dalmanni TaxID=139649 RepID=UPI0018CCF68D|nr:CCR4-NOT transcription complex subunit 2-like [Teleopsis dalmanni]